MAPTTVLTLERWVNASPIDKQDIITGLVQRLYELHRSIKPRFPWVLVYVLPREQKIGSLFIPGKHHKVSLEGIVLTTWGDWTEEKGTVEVDGVRRTRIVVHQSSHKLGDHVVFPHWSGLPLPGMDENYFRIVKELGWSKNEEGGIFGIVEYAEPYMSEQAKLRDLLEDALWPSRFVMDNDEDPSNQAHRELPGLIAAKIEEQFLLVDRKRGSVTLSAFGKDK